MIDKDDIKDDNIKICLYHNVESRKSHEFTKTHKHQFS